jgi:ABC-type sugar transport system ATPase subunit
VQCGELLALVGPSGSGKTTLLRLVAGLDRPTSGTILLGGRDLTGVPPRRRDVALVFQSLALYGHLTVEQNMAFALNAKTIGGWFRRGAVDGESKTRIAETASLLRIEHLLGRRPAELSGGEQQRVALGRAIVRRPQALLLDEPLSSLDLPLRRELRRELKVLQRKLGVPAIYVTHDQAEALAMGDRIAVLDRGRLAQAGAPNEIYERPKTRFVAEFFGPQGMNFIEGKLQRFKDIAVFRADEWQFRVTGEIEKLACPDRTHSIVCGFRPEDLIPGLGDLIGIVVGSETIGDAIYIWVRVPTQKDRSQVVVSRRLHDLRQPEIDQLIRLTLETGKLHWFDRTTGNKL